MADALAWPLLLLAADAQLLYANLEGRHLLARRNALKLSGSGRVQALPALQQQRFSAALQAAAEGRQALLHWSGSMGCAAVVRRMAEASLSPEQAVQHGSPAVLLVAVTMAATGRADSQTFARAHHLTRAESRVLQRLVLGDSPDEIAQHCRVTVATVRSQTAAIRRKTGHRSIAQLVGAVARGSPASGSSAPSRRSAASEPATVPKPTATAPMTQNPDTTARPLGQMGGSGESDD